VSRRYCRDEMMANARQVNLDYVKALLNSVYTGFV